MVAASAKVTPLTEEDARILELECGNIRGHLLKVLLIDDAPDQPLLEALRDSIAQRLPAVPRWRQRLTSLPETATGLGWTDDPDFDLARHVRLVPASAPLGPEEFRCLLGERMMMPLDRGHPLWSVELIPRLSDDRWALIWKVHHCLADGMAMMKAGSQLLWTEEKPQPPAPRLPRGDSSAAAQLKAGMRLAKVFGYRGLFLREFRRVRQLSPLADEVGPDRAVAFADCTLDELRAIGKAAEGGATVNDVLVAAVAGGLRRWLLSHGLPISRMKAQIPVSMQQQGRASDSSGNRDSFLLIELPLGQPDPVERLQRVSAATRLRKNRHDARAIYALRRSLSHAPERLRHRLQQVAQGPQEYSLNISNVPGPAGPIAVLGHRVHALYSVAEVSPHHALRVAAVSLHGRLSVGLCADPRVVPGLGSLARGIRDSIDEMCDRFVGRRSEERLPLAGHVPGANEVLAPPSERPMHH